MCYRLPHWFLACASVQNGLIRIKPVVQKFYFSPSNFNSIFCSNKYIRRNGRIKRYFFQLPTIFWCSRRITQYLNMMSRRGLLASSWCMKGTSEILGIFMYKSDKSSYRKRFFKLMSNNKDNANFDLSFYLRVQGFRLRFRKDHGRYHD